MGAKAPFCRLSEISSSDTESEKLEQHNFREDGLRVPSNNVNLSQQVCAELSPFLSSNLFTSFGSIFQMVGF
jgi:hypothetical protein